MSENIQETSGNIDQIQANHVAQLLNVVFNNATFYGGNHPSTQNSSEEFSTGLKDVFAIIPIVTLLRTGDSLYIEKWCVDQKMNAVRLIKIFSRAGIESISFEKGTTAHDVKTFVRIISDLQNFPSVDEMNVEMEKQQISQIRFNYVFFQKVTKDDAVVNKELLEGEKISNLEIEKDISKEIMPDFMAYTPGEAGDRNSISETGAVLSFKEIIENPDSIAGIILNESKKGNDGTQNAIDQLKTINERITKENVSEIGLSPDELMESIFKLSGELKQGLSLQNEMGRINEGDARIINEVDQLTYQAIIKIVREEYKNGKISVKRLAQIIRRILPDVKDLKRLLPQLKDKLVADGMSLADFFQLTNELNSELQSDGLREALEEGAEKIGLSVEEIVQAISTNPQEAAKIIVLASEIKQETGTDESALSGMLTDYIESVSGKMALESKETADQDGGKVLEQVIHSIESQLTDNLKNQGVPDTVVGEVEKQLAKKFPKRLQKLKADWMVNIITEEQDLSNSNLIRLMQGVVDKKTDFAKLKDPIEKALRAHGLGQDQVEEVFKEIVEHNQKNKESIRAHKNLLNKNNTKFFLQRQIKENLRYNNPFSCLTISINSKRKRDVWQGLKKDETKQVIPELCKLLKGLLRDLDLIGTMGTFEEGNLIIILPMTDEKGANAVKKRLDNKFLQSQFTIHGEKVALTIVVSVTSFNKKKTVGYIHFRELIDARHKIEEEMCSKL